MLTRSFAELTKCRLREFIREPSAAFFVFSMPILWMIILGLAFSSKHKEEISIGLIIPSVLKDSKSTQKLLKNLTREDHFKIIEASQTELRRKLRQNQISFILEVNEDFNLSYIYDATNPKSLLHKYEVDNLIQAEFGRRDSLATKDHPYTPSGSRYIDFLVPGLLALSLLTTSLFGTGMIIVVSRREKLLQRFLVTPMKPIEYFLSHITSRLIIVFFEVLAILLAAYFFFGFFVEGSLFSYFLVSFLGALCFTSLAILCSSRGKNSSAYSGFSNLIMILLMLLSGIWFSRGNFPIWLQNLSVFSPLSALVDALRKIALEGESLFQLTPEVSILLVYSLIFIGLSRKTFRWM